MTTAYQTIAIARETMTGDLMKCLIDEFKNAARPWPELSEEDQQNMIHRARQQVQDAVESAVYLIASDNRPTIVATVESVTVKDGIKAVLTLPKFDAQRHELFDASGQSVLLIVGGASAYYGGTEQVQAEPDQRPLKGFDDGERLSDAA